MLYIPTDRARLDRFHFQKYKSGNRIFSTEEQRETFRTFINQDSYLKKRKGKYTEAYGAYLPWYNRFNQHLVKDVHINLGKSAHILQVSLDILNMGNLLNSSWGCVHDARLL